jgi:hypothetical protein
MQFIGLPCVRPASAEASCWAAWGLRLSRTGAVEQDASAAVAPNARMVETRTLMKPLLAVVVGL